MGLGTFYVEHTINDSVYAPYCICVDGYVDNLRGGYEIDKNGTNITVTRIVLSHTFDAYEFEIYKVYTSDGHIRVLPADKYIAEWGE